MAKVSLQGVRVLGACREWLIPADFVNKRTIAIAQMVTDIWAG